MHLTATSQWQTLTLKLNYISTSGGSCSARAQLAEPSPQLSEPERVPETKPAQPGRAERETARASQHRQRETDPEKAPSTGARQSESEPARAARDRAQHWQLETDARAQLDSSKHRSRQTPRKTPSQSPAQPGVFDILGRTITSLHRIALMERNDIVIC
jgi:hypothetical protein